jgi:hypothetical protein
MLAISCFHLLHYHGNDMKHWMDEAPECVALSVLSQFCGSCPVVQSLASFHHCDQLPGVGSLFCFLCDITVLNNLSSILPLTMVGIGA